jgi:hypothetical protein
MGVAVGASVGVGVAEGVRDGDGDGVGEAVGEGMGVAGGTVAVGVGVALRALQVHPEAQSISNPSKRTAISRAPRCGCDPLLRDMAFIRMVPSPTLVGLLS